ncbi:MAG: hypothetical protein SBU_000721 [Candidatus Syntrophoarchaeum butanivorans]|uniref:Uncharacterized protein n=1 Tax=Candidatus Syntropharchaeum butanivorans TaxID=1839936 RepID=A0A1F2P4F0_9EURY|nr:MAG: hypothetical protein SBU_000721 [Candidatus Syntrophoarchaeum butanivorans]
MQILSFIPYHHLQSSSREEKYLSIGEEAETPMRSESFKGRNVTDIPYG